ncbi:hypothetical protein VKT23_018728 [Stygiomarasmius scandens]|uniref:Proteasome activator subunit 4 n=1 Tax=Marasmiellus scandens TaxID=2682957 RepID=A0ABR1IN50_9AGAR
MSYPLPANEAELLSVLGGLPYLKRNAYAIRLAKQHAENPKLLALINELLATSPLPSTVPYPTPKSSDPDAMVIDEPESDATIELQFPQTNASKRFVQREIGLLMASTVGKSALPILLEALVHPSNAGRNQVIAPCITFAGDDELVDVYNRCVPAVRAAIRAKLGRLGILGAAKDKKPLEPAIVTLERELKECEVNEREKIWAKSPALGVWPHRHLIDPKLVPQDSMLSLIEHLFELAERYPVPVNEGRDWQSFVLPKAFADRLGSFYVHDLQRTMNLIRKFAHAADPEKKARDVLHLPNTFNRGKRSSSFWPRVPLEQQMAIAEPFVTSLIEAGDGVLLKNGKLHKAGILACFRWPVVRSLMSKAMPYLTSSNIKNEERQHVLDFVLSGFDAFETRLSGVARVDLDVKRQHQTEMQAVAFDLIRQATDLMLENLRQTQKNDEDVVKQLRDRFIKRLPLHSYPALGRALYDKIAGIFSMTQVSHSELLSVAQFFFNCLKTKIPTIFDIPKDGIVQPYSNMPKVHNEDVFEVILGLRSREDWLKMYNPDILVLSDAQRKRVWDLVNDPEFILKQLTEKDAVPLSIFADLKSICPSPATRHPLVTAILKESESFVFANSLYKLCDITDDETRSALQKLTYTRVFDDRFEVYSALFEATRASKSVKEWIKTLKWFIPRTKNEIPPDAERLPNLFGPAETIVSLFKDADEEEAKELIELYTGWEKMNNEAVSVNYPLRTHLMSISQSCLQHFSGSVTNPFFQFGLDFAWTRILNDKGLAAARKTFFISIQSDNTRCINEEDELARRKFLQTVDQKLGRPGYWRIQDEEQFVEKIYDQLEKVYGDLSFKDSALYLTFIRNMANILGTRWNKVPRLVQELTDQMDIIRQSKGTPDKPAVWKPDANSSDKLGQALYFVQGIRNLRTSASYDEESLSWWREYRALKLLSSLAVSEANDRHSECHDKKTHKVDHDKLNELVEKLLGIHDSAIYIRFVQNHIMQRRQDLLKDHYITEARTGVFNQLSEDEEPLPPAWDLSDARKLSPHQCQVFGQRLDEIIHSEDTPFRERVTAAEQFTKLPTTTIHELAALLKEDLNPRISEAVLMFLPRLDEPPAGIQFLLAPVVLDGDLARTAIFGVKRSLEYVKPQDAAAMIAATFPPESSGRYLKVTVAKELARTICEYADIPEAQVVIRRLWDRKLHPDVRVALLQSIIPLLGSPQEELAWYAILNAVKNPKLQLDDTLFSLVSVTPVKPENHDEGIGLTSLRMSPVQFELSVNAIPNRCCDKYVDEVLWPLARLKQYGETETMSKHDVEKLKERVMYIRRGAYNALFEHFLTTSNAAKFAGRAMDDITHAHLEAPASEPEEISAACPFCAARRYPEDPVDCYLVYTFLVNAIARCIAKDPTAWSSLVKVVDSLALLSREMKDRPTRSGLLAYHWLNAMGLGSKFFFENPPHIRKRVTLDRMSLLEPLKKHDVWDQFSNLTLNRRIRWLEYNSLREKENVIKSEAGLVINEIVKMAQSSLLDKGDSISRIGRVLGAFSKTMKLALCSAILVGEYGVSDSSWSLHIKTEALKQVWHASDEYARMLSSFITDVATNEPSFYRSHWRFLAGLVSQLFTDKEYSRSQSAYPTLIHPFLERDGPGTVDRLALDYLFEQMWTRICPNSPDWVLQRTHDLLLSAKPEDGPFAQAVQFSKILMTHVGYYDIRQLTLTQCMVAESVYFGTVLNLNLKHTGPSEPVITYPYFFSTDDSGGDIEDRKGKSTVSALEASYEARKAKLGTQFLKSASMETNASSTTLAVLMKLYDHYPKLAIAHPSLFFSCLCLSLSSPDMLDKSTKLVSLLKDILKPRKEGESGSKWGWVPPPSLALSFARKMLTEAPEEISDISLDQNWMVGPIQCKLYAVDLLLWWRTTYKDGSKNMDALLQAEGLDGLTREYEELKMMVWKDRELVVHSSVLPLFAGDLTVPSYSNN